MNKKKLLREPFFVLENFHPVALFIACGILLLIIQKTNANGPFLEKLTFGILAGPLYLIDITFESWRIATKESKKTNNSINSR